MSQWPNGQPNMFSQQAAMYNNPTTSPFDLNSPFNQGIPNGNTSTPNGAYPPQSFQTGSVVPAKRPHDGMSASPQQLSRSQTPSYPAFNNNGTANPQHFQSAPNPYQHLQQSNSNNATPSPTMSSQQFRPPQAQSGLQNVSPSPYSQAQTNAHGANFPTHMTPATPQSQNQGVNMAQQMAQWNQGMTTMGNTSNMQMGSATSGMSTPLNNVGMNGQNIINAQAHQAKLMQQRQAMLQMQQAGINSMPPYGRLPNQAPQQNVSQLQQQGQLGQSMMHMTNGVGGATSAMGLNPQQQMQAKKNAFLKQLAVTASQQGRQINLQPQIDGKSVDLYTLWSSVAQAFGSAAVERTGQWPVIAAKLGFAQADHPTSAGEVKQIFLSTLASYERAFMAVKAQQKQEQARFNAQQMAGLGAAQQSSPTKSMMQPVAQTAQFAFPQGVQAQNLSQAQQASLVQVYNQAQSTPVQANAQLPQNGMVTPQQMMQHRRNSSLRRPEQMTPMGAQPAVAAPSPHPTPKVQQSPPIKSEMKMENHSVHEQPPSTNYEPLSHVIGLDGGYDVNALYEFGTVISRFVPNMPAIDEMGVIDTKAITLSLASGIHSEVRYALDMLATISHDARISFDLEKCDDLIDVIIDCADDQIEVLDENHSDENATVELLSYGDVLRACRSETDTFQEVPQQGTLEYNKDRAVERLLAITTILRNFSFFDCNHPLLTGSTVIKWLSNTIRLLGTRMSFLRTAFNTQDFYKDIIIFFSNVSQSLELTSRDDALHVLHFLLAFAPQPQPLPNGSDRGSLRFPSFVPTVHRYLPPAVDSLAKLLARQEPNRTHYRAIFNNVNGAIESSEDLITRSFGLAISILPDRSKGALSNNMQLRIVEARKASLSQGLLAADILTTLVPSTNSTIARSWLESADGWAVSLLNLAALLSVDRTPASQQSKSREQNAELESNKMITHRALSMMKRLAEKAARAADNAPRTIPSVDRGNDADVEGSDEEETADLPKWDSMPQGHAVLGALMLLNTDRVALGLLCSLHDMAMQSNP